MKNKILCHFDKINKFIRSEHFIDDVLPPLITVAVVILSIVFCMLFIPFSASAADYDSTMILKAGTYRFNDFLKFNLPVGVYSANVRGTSVLIYEEENITAHIEFSGISFSVEDYGSTLYGLSFDGVTTSDITPEAWIIGGAGLVYVGTDEEASYPFPSLQTHTITEDAEVDDTFGTWYIANTNYNEVNGGSPSECPTLEEQIAQYSGSWVQFINMVRQNNHSLANSYQNNIDLAIQSGANSVTLEQRLSEFNGDWQDFERLMAEYNVDLQTMYTSYVNSLETQAFEDGRVFGNDEGYKNGYLSGLNKGQSDNALKGFFGNFIGGVIDVVDSIHFYEEFDSNGNLTFYLSPWSIVIVVLMVAIVIIFLKVFRGG